MAKTTHAQNSLNCGEVSPRALGRFDLAKYANACKTMLNFLGYQLGGASFRPGTRFVGETRYSAKKSRLISFQYSASQDYVIEAGDAYMRFYANDASVIVTTAWDSYTKFLTHADGTDGDTTVIDEIGKTVTNTETYDSYTKFMCHFDGTNTTFVDQIDNVNHAITPNGNITQTNAQSKFGGKSAVSAGPGDYISILDSDDWSFGTGDFTVDCWVRFTDLTGTQGIIYQYTNANNWWRLKTDGSTDHKLGIYFIIGGVVKGNYTMTNAWSGIAIDTWYHLVFERYGTGAKIFINGVSQPLTETVAFGTNDVGNISSPLIVGDQLLGYIDELRISKGIARWTANFTAPVQPYGQVRISTTQKKFGTGSLLFDGSGSYLSLADSADWDFGTGDFTIDFWVYFNTLDQQIFCGQFENAQNFWELFKTANNRLIMSFFKGNVDKGSYEATWTGVAIHTWYHLAFERTSTTAKIFINGISQTLVDEGTTFGTNDVGDIASTLFVGQLNSANYMNGYIDELRISKGVARWTADFTAPTAPYAKLPVFDISAPYAVADIGGLQWAQQADTMYVVHPLYPPYKLVRIGAALFTITKAPLVRGPFLDSNITATTIAPNKNTGNDCTLTATTAIFDAKHGGSISGEGAMFRVKGGVVKIHTFTDTKHVIGNIMAEPSGVAGDLGTGVGFTPTTDWAEGAFSDYNGWPTTVAFHDQRLYYANTVNEPQKLWGSVVQTYDDFAVGSATATDAVSFQIATEQVNAIYWLASAPKNMQIGTNSGTFTASSGGAGLAITPSAIFVQRDTTLGVAAIRPRFISSYLYYLQRNMNQIREMVYSFALDRQVTIDMNMLADHMLRDGAGAIEMDQQQSPNDRIWCVRDDGQIAVLTRNAEQDVVGWTRIVAAADSSGQAGVIESIAVIPKVGQDDQVWVIVRRNIGGSTKRFVEFFTLEFPQDDWDNIRVDCSLTLDNPKTLATPYMTNASPGIFTSTAHGFTGGEQVKITGVVLADVAGVASTDINGTYLLVYISAGTFSLTTLAGVAINTTTANGYGVYVSGGEVRKMVTNISGLGHLVGETVSVQVDGTLPTTETYVVASDGSITLSAKAAVVHAGLKYTGRIQLLKLTDGSKSTGQTKNRRVYLSTIRVSKTKQLAIGMDTTNVEAVNFADPNYLLTTPFSGDIERPFNTYWTKEGEFVIDALKPLELFILAVCLRSEVEEKD